MKDIILSKRMEAVVNMVSPQSFTIADIGCDHAYVSIALIKQEIAKRVLAMDVRKGPLEIAAKNVSLYGENDTITLRLSDGLEKLSPGEADEIIIAGMGGLLIKSILEKGIHILSYEEKRPSLILQPQSDINEVRKFLYAHSYHIVREEMLIDEGKYYTVLRVEPGALEADFAEAEWLYGKYLLDNKNPVLHEFLLKEKQTLLDILSALEHQSSEKVSPKTLERIETLHKEIDVNIQALEHFN